MTQDEKRIAIAEAWGAFPGSINKESWLGYFPVQYSEILYSLNYMTDSMLEESDEKAGYVLARCPHFFGDLNAIHAAIQQRIVHGPDIIQFRGNESLFQEQLDIISEREQVPCWHFTADVYAEAFGLTLKLWEPDSNKS